MAHAVVRRRKSQFDRWSASRAWGHARAAAEHPWLEGFLRFGFVVRGAVYLIVGSLALRLALGRGGAAITQRQAIEMLAREPFGRALLMAVAIGLGAYALWGFVRAAFDPLERGRTPHGVARRLGYLSSGVGYAASSAVTAGMLVGVSHRSAPIDWLARVLSWPGGPWIVGAIGLGWVAGAGVSEIVKAVRGSFRRDLQLDVMGPHEHDMATWLGGFGIAARGLVLGIIGVSLLAAAWHADATRRLGMGGALLRLSHAPHGRYLLGVVALGLVAFGVFSIFCAVWARTWPRRAVPRVQHLWWRRRSRAQEIVETTPGTLVLVNPTSGTDGENTERLKEITEYLRAHGMEARGVLSGSMRTMRKIARAAVGAGKPLLVVAGGDGTVRTAALELAGSSTALGLIPLGTMNNVARSLGVPMEVEGACERIVAGSMCKIDLGRMTLRRRWRGGHARKYTFVECAGVGLSAFAAFTGETIEKHRWWQLPAALRRFFVARRAAVHVELDGKTLPVGTNIVTVLNSPLLGTNLLAAPEAKMDDGLLEVLVYEGWSDTEIARHFLAVKRGEPAQVPVHRARRVRIWSDEPMLTHMETNEGRRSRVVEIEAMPGALTMIVGDGMAIGRS